MLFQRSSDGNTLVVSSTDGYWSIINFKAGELGQVYQPKDVSDKEDMVIKYEAFQEDNNHDTNVTAIEEKELSDKKDVIKNEALQEDNNKDTNVTAVKEVQQSEVENGCPTEPMEVSFKIHGTENIEFWYIIVINITRILRFHSL